MLDHYLHTALAAATLLEPQQPRMSPARSVEGVALGRFAGRREAADWFETEHPALMAVITLAADLGFDLHACQLHATLIGVVARSARWQDLASSSEIALATAQRTGSREAEAYALRGLGGACTRLGQYEEAHAHLQRCLEQFTELGNVDGQARAHLNLACLLHSMDDDKKALSHAHRARELFELAGQQQAGLAASLNTVGWFEARLGNTELGLAYCQRALRLAQRVDDRVITAATWDSLGYVRHLLGQHELAVSCYQKAAAIYADLGAVWYRADVLNNLADAHEASGNRQAARGLWQEALKVFEQTHHPDTERLRARLRDTRGQEAPFPGDANRQS